MGYYTRYELTTSDYGKAHTCPTCGSKGVVNHMDLISKELDYNPFYDACKWYSWKEDMLKYSKQYPDVLFTLHGEGEETGDIWKAYIQNGKTQVEAATFQVASFDPSKLE